MEMDERSRDKQNVTSITESLAALLNTTLSRTARITKSRNGRCGFLTDRSGRSTFVMEIFPRYRVQDIQAHTTNRSEWPYERPSGVVKTH